MIMIIYDYGSSRNNDNTYSGHVIHLRIMNKIQYVNNVMYNNQFKHSTHFKKEFFKFQDVH